MNKRPKILIVEDDKMTSKLYNFYLEKYDVDVLSAQDGLEALNIVKNNSDIDLIMMNYMMPIMDGMESTTKIREFNKDIFIIMISTVNSAGELSKKAFEIGCNDYFSSPFRLTEFVERIEYFLNCKLVKK